MSTSSTSPGSDKSLATGTSLPGLPIAFKANFALNTTDGLRSISFGLEKDTDGVKVDWTISFTLYERSDTTQPFGAPIVSLNVFVASTLHTNAETAAHNGLSPAQTAHAVGPAAEAAKQAQAGTMALPVANHIIQNTLK